MITESPRAPRVQHALQPREHCGEREGENFAFDMRKRPISNRHYLALPLSFAELVKTDRPKIIWNGNEVLYNEIEREKEKEEVRGDGKVVGVDRGVFFFR